MSPILNWFKVVEIPNGAEAGTLPGRALLLGGGSIKSGSLVELRGLRYSPKPEIEQFDIYRRHFFHHDQYSCVDSTPTMFGDVPGFGHGAQSPSIPLRSRHGRAINRTFQFRDALGNSSSDISTARFGRMEVTAVELWGTGGAAGHVPYGSGKFHVLAKPMKDPLVEFSVLTAGGVFPAGSNFPERGYANLEDLIQAEISDVDVGDELRSLVETLLTVSTDINVGIEPRIFEIGDGQTGECEISFEIRGAGTFTFAVQGISFPDEELMRLLESEEDPEDPIDPTLRGVMVSDVVSITLLENGVIFTG